MVSWTLPTLERTYGAQAAVIVRGGDAAARMTWCMGGTLAIPLFLCAAHSLWAVWMLLGALAVVCACIAARFRLRVTREGAVLVRTVFGVPWSVRRLVSPRLYVWDSWEGDDLLIDDPGFAVSGDPEFEAQGFWCTPISDDKGAAALVAGYDAAVTEVRGSAFADLGHVPAR